MSKESKQDIKNETFLKTTIYLSKETNEKLKELMEIYNENRSKCIANCIDEVYILTIQQYE